MNKQGPNLHDDPRIEAGDASKDFTIPSEAMRRTARNGADLVRLAIGTDEKNSLDAKVEFHTPEAQRLASFIDNSDIKKPQIKNRIVTMIDFAADKGSITPDEATGLRHYLEHAEGFSDDKGRPKDTQERRSGS